MSIIGRMVDAYSEYEMKKIIKEYGGQEKWDASIREAERLEQQEKQRKQHCAQLRNEICEIKKTYAECFGVEYRRKMNQIKSDMKLLNLHDNFPKLAEEAEKEWQRKQDLHRLIVSKYRQFIGMNEPYEAELAQWRVGADRAMDSLRKNEVLPYQKQAEKWKRERKSLLMDPQHYGEINKTFWARVRSLDKETAHQECLRVIQAEFLDLDPDSLIQHAMFYATENAGDSFMYFAKALEGPEKRLQLDLVIGELYAVKHGYWELSGPLSPCAGRLERLEETGSAEDLLLVASALKWMGDFEKEKQLLQRLRDRSMAMGPVARKRLQLLEKAGQTWNQKKEALRGLQMMCADAYGKVNMAYWNQMRAMTTEEADAIVQQFIQAYRPGEKDLTTLCHLDPRGLMRCIWFYATEPIFDAKKWNQAAIKLSWAVDMEHIEVKIAELCALMRVGGEEAVQKRLPGYAYLKRVEYGSRSNAEHLASALKWMKAFKAEKTVLQMMLQNSQPLSQEAQERLFMLQSGGNVPVEREIEAGASECYFDLTSLAWKAADYEAFFNNLKFQGKTLAYALTIRDEDQSLVLSRGVKVPEPQTLLAHLKLVFEEEYDDTAAVKCVNYAAMTGNAEEKGQGILAWTKECPQMGVLLQLIRIGKKLNIKFYTLLMPGKESAETQKQQALMLLDAISPTTKMWESSLKESALAGIQQLLNVGGAGQIDVGNVGGGSMTNGAGGEPIF